MSKEKGVEIQKDELLEEIGFALKDYFVGKTVLTDNGLRISFCNGQNFVLKICAE